MTDSSPASDSSEPVLVSRPASPRLSSPAASSTLPTRTPPPVPPRLQQPSPLSSTQSPTPPVTVLKDSASETVAALDPSPAVNTTSGLGRAGEEEVAHLGAQGGRVLGGAEGVVGEGKGLEPEWIVKVRKAERTPGEGSDAADAEETLLGPSSASTLTGPSSASTLTGPPSMVTSTDAGDDDGKKPKWFKKVKEGLSSAASSIKDKTQGGGSDAGSTTSSPARTRADSLDLPPGGMRRGRARSIGQKSAVSFQLDEDDAPAVASRAAAAKIVTDTDGLPVPVDVGVGGIEAATPASSMPEGVVPAPGASASMATSVKDKILEAYDVEPGTTHEKFHSIFSELPEDEELIEDYRCALVRDILVQGKLYVSEHYLSFRANILGWETSLQIPWTEIVSIEKRMTAKIIPNAIEVRTLHATHNFASFIARDASYALLVAVWKHVHPEAEQLRASSRQAAKDEKRRLRSLSTASARSAPTMIGSDSDSDGDSDDKSEISFEDEQGQKKRHRFKRGLASLKLSNIRSRENTVSSAVPPVVPVAGGPTEAEKVKAAAVAGAGAGDSAHAPTSYDGAEFKNVALDAVLPTSPKRAYELFFANADFLRAFMEEKEGLKEVDIGAWRPFAGTCEERDLSYLKPLNAPVGPKQTHCFIHDLNEHVDEETYIANLTTTKTPDVPSGDNFSTVTRTVFTWAQGGGCHVRVTTEVAWTKVNRLLRGVIERGAVDGQVGYHKDLEAAVRAHIAAHPDEFAVAGSAPAATPTPEVKTTDTVAVERPSSASSAGGGGGGLLDTLMDLDPLTAVLIALVAFLALSNLFTLLSLRKHASAARAARLGHPAEVASAVERVLGQFSAAHAARAAGPGGEGAGGEVELLKEAMRALEGHMEGVMGEMGRAVRTVRELADRAEGVRGML
ncbi:hypothetical protein JCM10449v2_005567 [Rhodotorula kratochvilovae]